MKRYINGSNDSDFSYSRNKQPGMDGQTGKRCNRRKRKGRKKKRAKKSRPGRKKPGRRIDAGKAEEEKKKKVGSSPARLPRRQVTASEKRGRSKKGKKRMQPHRNASMEEGDIRCFDASIDRQLVDLVKNFFFSFLASA